VQAALQKELTCICGRTIVSPNRLQFMVIFETVHSNPAIKEG